MPYAVIADGISAVYTDYSQVERILALYPYTKFRKRKTIEECELFLQQYRRNNHYSTVFKYGDVFDNNYITLEYFIGKDCIYYNFITTKTGPIKIYNDSENVVIEYRKNNIKVMLLNMILDNDMISGHLIAIYHALKILGDYIDVNVVVPDHSIFYALTTYSGESNVIKRVTKSINERLGAFAVSMPVLRGENSYTEEDLWE